jgi:predicted CopG family antitoxin
LSNKSTTIKINLEVKKLLDELKLCGDESYNHTIERIIKKLKEGSNQ